MRGRMVLALTVALVEQARRPWIVDGQIIGAVGPRLRLLAAEGAAGQIEPTVIPTIPDVVIPPEDRKAR